MNYPIHTLFSRTAKAQQNYLRPHLSALGLSTGQPKILRVLTAQGPCSQRKLADLCDVDPSAICRTLDCMERDGFLTRTQSQTDRRAGLVELTEKGRTAFETWEHQCMVLEDQMLQDFSPEEREQLADFLARAYRNVGGHLP